MRGPHNTHSKNHMPNTRDEVYNTTAMVFGDDGTSWCYASKASIIYQRFRASMYSSTELGYGLFCLIYWLPLQNNSFCSIFIFSYHPQHLQSCRHINAMASQITMVSIVCSTLCLIHWGRDKMAAISQTTFPNAFSWMKMYGFRLRFHCSLFQRFELTILQHWFR